MSKKGKEGKKKKECRKRKEGLVIRKKKKKKHGYVAESGKKNCYDNDNRQVRSSANKL
jgi:hypothetical protein